MSISAGAGERSQAGWEGITDRNNWYNKLAHSSSSSSYAEMKSMHPKFTQQLSILD